ncbi:CAF17-like 4Fe-4S cluster assembly/insertion protein YgfZ [Lysobacter sp. A3-1-A15]|uniref:CAF17-like 4Fe-4S cluster assembly/insertion protein YgfZ n=1 Tax=Novilysobacter viscosus TaxID=3098602 RepID=UPI002ED95546
MPDNPQTPEPRDFRLDGHAVLALSGPDATAFAQAQFMNDVAALDVLDWQWNGWLTPKGRVVALFALLRRDDQTLWAVMPDADPATVCSALSRFLFRSKVRIDVLEDVAAVGRFAAPASATAGRASTADGEVVELDMGGDGGARTLRLGPADCGEPHAASNRRWVEQDLRHGLPRLPPSQAGHWTPQQLSLQRLRAFSVKKGCYPGQEIVARTHFLGKVKRGLALLEADAPVEVGADVRSGATPLGTVVSSCAMPPAGAVALAVLPLERPATGLDAGGTPVREGDLLDGLARRHDRSS